MNTERTIEWLATVDFRNPAQPFELHTNDGESTYYLTPAGTELKSILATRLAQRSSKPTTNTIALPQANARPDTQYRSV